MQSNYTPDLQKLFQMSTTPFGIVKDIVEYPGWLAIVVYKDQTDKLTVDQQIQVAESLYQLRNIMRLMGVQVEVERREGSPPKL